jgi:transcriptional regulator with PAS, ATPase and Fis domain
MNDVYQIIFSHSPKMSKVKTIVEEIAKTDITVLIKGESGTGKDLLAQAIHLNSHRKDNPFVKVNCAAIPRGLLESELFGFEKGAFTGAHFRKPGKFELANDGTILLNDIGEMDIAVQAKLLQVLQDGMFCRLGGEGDVLVNTRVIATTQDHLERSMMEGHFRQDLFFRINVINITVPPLRERREQILPLVQFYLDFYRKRYGKDGPPLSSKIIDAFKEYLWPGNIRELENLVKRTIILGEEDTVMKILLGKKSDEKAEPNPLGSALASVEKGIFDLKEEGKKAVETAEKEIIQRTLLETHWNRKHAAKLLHVSYKSLLYKIQKYHLNNLRTD